MLTLVKLLAPFVLDIALTIWRGWFITILWVWFVIPYFHADPLPLVIAIGLLIIYKMFSFNAPEIKEIHWEEYLVKYIVIFLVPPILLFIALPFSYLV